MPMAQNVSPNKALKALQVRSSGIGTRENDAQPAP